MTSYRSSIETIALNCLFLRKSRFLHFGDRQTDKQTEEQMDSIDALSHSRCRERRLNNLNNVVKMLLYFERKPISGSSVINFILGNANLV